MAKKYTVTGACVTHVPAAGPDGPVLVTLYQGAQLPEGVPQDRIKHLLDSHLIEATGDDADEALAEAFAPNNQEPARQPGIEPEPDPDAPKPVDGRSSKATLVDHAVRQGMSREDAEAMTRDDLLDKYVRKPAE